VNVTKQSTFSTFGLAAFGLASFGLAIFGLTAFGIAAFGLANGPLNGGEGNEGEDLTESGIKFQMAEAAHRKARAPKLVMMEGSRRSRSSAERRPE